MQNKMRRIAITLFVALVLSVLPAFAASFGSGFIISDSGHIVTCDHCVPEGARIAVLTHDGLSHEATVVFRNAELDLACLKIDTPTKIHLPIGDSTAAKILDPVYVFGFPLPSAIGSELSASLGSLNAIRSKDGLHLLQIDAPVNPGNSGGPVLNGVGAVVGIAVSKLDPLKVIEQLGTIPERINFAVPSSVLRTELQRNGVTFTSPTASRDLDSLRTLATAATVQIVAAPAGPKEELIDPLMPDSELSPMAITARAAVDYVLRGNSADLDVELSIYAPKVDYYDRGLRDIAFIRDDLSALRKRWPERYYVITSVDQVSIGADKAIGTATVHFRFALFNSEKFFRGEANTFLVFDLSSHEPKTILVREHKTRKKKG
jgi:hypothetical protein